MSYLNNFADGLRTILRAAGLTVVPFTAAATDHTVTLSVRLVDGSYDADGEHSTFSDLQGTVEIAVTVLMRASITGDVQWLGETGETVMKALGTVRNQTIGGLPVGFISYTYSADLGLGDRGRPEASDNYTVHAGRPALV